MRPIQKRYQREFAIAMFGYVVVLFGSIWLLKTHGAGFALWFRSLLALLPVLPISFVARAITRSIRASDELERQVALEAAGIAGLLVGVGFFSVGLLAAAKVIALEGSAVAIWVFPILCGTYGLARAWASRRYQG